MRTASFSFYNTLPVKLLCYLFLLVPLFVFPQKEESSSRSQFSVVDYVNPFIGTDGTERRFEGRTHPGALRPFGMVSVTPFTAYDTTLATNIWDHRRFQAPYFKSRPTLSGFSHVNLSGVGCPDLGAILLMPTTGPLELTVNQYMSSYSKEKASPGYYSTELSKYAILAEMSATERSGISQYTFPKGQSNIILNLGLAQTNVKGGAIKILSPTKIEGHRLVGNFCGETGTKEVFFAMKISKTPLSYGIWHEDMVVQKQELSGNNIGAFFQFNTASKEQVQVRIGISYVSTKNAWLNLNEEQRDFSFEKIRQEAEQVWEMELSKIIVKGGSLDDKTIFYTALYHTLIHPNLFNDVDGTYPSMGSHLPRVAKDYDRYTVFSLWDTYRNLHQLLTLLYPERQSDMIQSVLGMFEENVWLPKWELLGTETHVMVGDPAVAMIADSYVKGIQDFDVEKAYQALRKHTFTVDGSNIMRPGMEVYLNYGYIPMDTQTHQEVWGPVSTTLEYNVADYAMAQMALQLGKKEDYYNLMKRTKGYQNLFNPKNNFLQPKMKNGDWYPSFDPLLEKWPGGPGYVEGNAWHYAFFVPHDIKGLAKLYKNETDFLAQLDRCFDEEHFTMGNEPDIGYPFIYNYFEGQEWKTQRIVRKLVRENYGNSPYGIPGNDDCGTMSAWLVFAMMGLYPDVPGKPEYQISTPFFDQIEIGLNPKYCPGEKFTITTDKNPLTHPYIKEMKLNSKSHKHFTITQNTITQGGNITLKLDIKPAQYED